MEPTPTIEESVEESFENLTLNPTIPIEPVKLWYTDTETLEMFPDDVTL